jgi:hypothetical protein
MRNIIQNSCTIKYSQRKIPFERHRYENNTKMVIEKNMVWKFRLDLVSSKVHTIAGFCWTGDERYCYTTTACVLTSQQL